MKQTRGLIFILSVFLLLLGLWYVFPSEGLKIGKVVFRFPSFASYSEELKSGKSEVDVDSLLLAVKKSYEIPQESEEFLKYCHDYLDSNANRIYLPNDDYTFFDSLFVNLERLSSKKVVRVLHYGDSQLEMDRISGILRQKLQERFGGSGPGMVPMIQKIPSVSVTQRASGGISRYSMVSDSLSKWASHHKYGPLTQFTKVNDRATFTFTRSESRYSQELARQISKVSVLLGENSAGLKLTLKYDTVSVVSVIDSAKAGVSRISWNLPYAVKKGEVTIEGNADVYAFMLDAHKGVTVDNVPLRGSAGTIFDNIEPNMMKESLALSDVKMIIMEFGGNAMTWTSSKKAISKYVSQVKEQFDYFRKVASPDCEIMFIGPADMCKSVDGNIVSWPMLSQMNDSLRHVCLENNVAYWDTFNVMGGAGSMKKWVSHNPPFAGPDYIHFTTRGANEIGEALSKSFLLYHDLFKMRQKLSNEAVENFFAKIDSTNSTGINIVKTDSLNFAKEGGGE